MAFHFLISQHAIDRFIERYTRTALEPRTVQRVLLSELKRGCGLARQYGAEELYLLPCCLVAVIEWRKDFGVVKTILTREQAIATMESQGAIRRRTDRVPRPDELRALAERHVKEGLSQNEGEVHLKALGYDPARKAGFLYRAAYRSARFEEARRKLERAS
jgi:hypothetical protein